ATFDAAEPGRDAFEMDLVRRALDADLPVFAICRGIQVLNVARGGTLLQDIPTELRTPVEHMVREPRIAIAHDIDVTADSLLDRLMRAGGREPGVLPVNSRHHQAPKAPGD